MDNPWADLYVRADANTGAPRYMARVDCDRLTEKVIAEKKLRLDHHPVPWLGDPRRAPVVLLTNSPRIEATHPPAPPDYGEQNRLCLTFESRVPLFSLDDAFKGRDDTGYYYWVEHLCELIVCSGLDQVRRHVAVVEWFPYHAPRTPDMRTPLPSQEYGFQLVEQAIKERALIVLIRGERKWFDAVDGLARIKGTDRFIKCKVPRRGTVSRRNMSRGEFERVCAAVADGARDV